MCAGSTAFSGPAAGAAVLPHRRPLVYVSVRILADEQVCVFQLDILRQYLFLSGIGLLGCSEQAQAATAPLVFGGGRVVLPAVAVGFAVGPPYPAFAGAGMCGMAAGISCRHLVLTSRSPPAAFFLPFGRLGELSSGGRWRASNRVVRRQLARALRLVVPPAWPWRVGMARYGFAGCHAIFAYKSRQVSRDLYRSGAGRRVDGRGCIGCMV